MAKWWLCLPILMDAVWFRFGLSDFAFSCYQNLFLFLYWLSFLLPEGPSTLQWSKYPENHHGWNTELSTFLSTRSVWKLCHSGKFWICNLHHDNHNSHSLLIYVSSFSLLEFDPYFLFSWFLLACLAVWETSGKDWNYSKASWSNSAIQSAEICFKCCWEMLNLWQSRTTEKYHKWDAWFHRW